MELPFLPDREFFTMREVSRIAHVPAHTLRYWEERFGRLRPARGTGGHRRYTRADLELILKIKELTHQRRLTLAGAKLALSERRPEPAPGTAAAAPESAASTRLLREVKKEIKMLLDEFGR